MNTHSATAHRSARSLTIALALVALGGACAPTSGDAPGARAGYPITIPSAGATVSTTAAGGGAQRTIPARPQSAPAVASPDTPATGPAGPTSAPLTVSTPAPPAGADLAEADALLSDLHTHLSEADSDLVTPEGDF